MTGGNAAIEPQKAGLDPFYVDARYTSADFFSMFRVPFVAGTGWSAQDDDTNARVVVIALLDCRSYSGVVISMLILRVSGDIV